MVSEKNLYNDQLEGNAEAVDGMFESLMIDYTLSQLHSLAKAAKISIRACSHKNSIKNHSEHDNRKKNNIEFIVTSADFSKTL